MTHTYEEERVIEKSEQAKNLKRLKNIAGILGFIPDKKNENASIHMKKGHQCLWLHAGGWRNKGRLEINGVYPRDIKGSYTISGYDNNPKSITISLTKTDEQIAREIEKRFIPLYLPALELALKRVAEVAQAEQDRNHVINELGKILGIKPEIEGQKNGHNTNEKASIHHWRDNETDLIQSMDIKTDYHAKEVIFDLRVSNELAISIAELLSLFVKKGGK